MKNKEYLYISIQIVLIFLIAMFVSLIPDIYPKFFGDWLCQGRSPNNTLCYKGLNDHIPEWHWGYRHHLLFWMGFTLFGIQIIRLIDYIINAIK